MIKDFKEKQADWIADVIAPLGEAGIGQDPRYGERFSQLKAEIENKVETNFEAIFVTALEILQKEGKDLRVAGYLLFAATRLQGAEGFTFGLQVLTQLLASFGSTTFPEKQRTKQAALNWIAQDRIIHFIETYSDALSVEVLALLQQVYLEFCEAVKPVLEDDFHWKKLNDWFEKRQASNPLLKSNQSTNITDSTTPIQTSKTALTEIQSDTQLTQAVRQLLNYYKKNKLYGTYAALARTVRWADLKLPPAENKITRIPPPTPTDLTKIETLMEQGQWLDAWLAGEDALMSPSGLFFLDYQRISHQCAQMIGLNEVAHAISSHLVSLVKRLPTISGLKFADESSFASSRTLGWLEQLLTSSPNEHQETADYLVKAQEKTQLVGLTTALKWLDEQQAFGELERLRFKLIQAQLCVENNQSNLALPLLKKLNDRLLEDKIQYLEPSLALQVWRQLQFALEDQLRKTKGSEEKKNIKKHLEQVNHQICSTDITTASQWL